MATVRAGRRRRFSFTRNAGLAAPARTTPPTTAATVDLRDPVFPRRPLSGPPAPALNGNWASSSTIATNGAGGCQRRHLLAESTRRDQPASWGTLRFGLPGYVAQTSPVTGQATIRRATPVGRHRARRRCWCTITNQCPGDDFHIWNEWANRNTGDAPDFNIQESIGHRRLAVFRPVLCHLPLIDPGRQARRIGDANLHQYGNSGDAGQGPSPHGSRC